MRTTTLVAALVLAATPALLNAQATSAYGKASAKTTAGKKTVKHKKTTPATSTSTSKGEVMTTETTTMAMPMAKPETVYVKGSVTGEIPPPGADIRGVTGVITSYTIYDTTNASATMPVMTDTTTSNPTLDRKVSHGAGEVAEDASSTGKKAGKDISNAGKKAASDASKLGKKAVHGAKEVGSDIKKKVTGKP